MQALWPPLPAILPLSLSLSFSPSPLPPKPLLGLMWLMGGVGTGDNQTAELSLACSVAAWLCPLCVCMCVLSVCGPAVRCNPVEMKGAAAHWPGDYSAALSGCQDRPG